ncbi:MAG: zinc ribbon domain-containing protein [Thermofilum sp.]
MGELLTWYQRSLDKALEAIWHGIEWRGDPKHLKRYGRFRIPKLPSTEFLRRLRGQLLASCPYAAHWVDAVVRDAFRIMKSWRKRYLEGKARKKRPRVAKRFARVKSTLLKVDYEAKTVRVTIRPGEYVAVSWAGAWFEERVQGWEVGEPVLRDDTVILVFEKAVEDQRCAVVGWDCNEYTLNGFDGQRFYSVSLEPLVRMKERYEEVISRLQSAGKGELAKKYRKRLRDRERDFVSKLAKQLADAFPGAVFAFEDLDKEKLVSREVPKERRKRNWRAPWVSIQNKVAEKAPVVRVSARNTSRTCPRCGWRAKEDPGKVFHCKRCGLVMDRQRLAAVNVWRRAAKKLGLKAELPPRFWELPELKIEVRLAESAWLRRGDPAPSPPGRPGRGKRPSGVSPAAAETRLRGGVTLSGAS